MIRTLLYFFFPENYCVFSLLQIDNKVSVYFQAILCEVMYINCSMKLNKLEEIIDLFIASHIHIKGPGVRVRES